MDDAFRSNKSTLSVPQLRAQITELAGHLNAGNHRFLMLIASSIVAMGGPMGRRSPVRTG